MSRPSPIAGPPPPAAYGNEMKFDISLNPAADLDMECEHATPGPSTVTLDGSKLAVLWRGSGANESNENELGHALCGEGHPDEGFGRAPLPGTDHSKRLISTIATRAAGAKLLVKAEWTRAKANLQVIEDNR